MQKNVAFRSFIMVFLAENPQILHCNINYHCMINYYVQKNVTSRSFIVFSAEKPHILEYNINYH